MVDVLTAIWNGLLAVGTTATLTVIVMLALAINALTIFYVSSAVVVLERFARVARSWLWVTICGLAVALAAAYFLRLTLPAEFAVQGDARDPLRDLVATTAGTGLVTVFAIGVCWTALRWLRSAMLGSIVLGALGLCVALFLGSTGRVGFALAPPLGALVVAGLLFAFRRRRADGGVGLAERQLLWLALVLALGPVVAAALPGARFELVTAAGGILQLVQGLIVLGLLPLAAAGLIEMRRSAEWFLAVRYLVAQRRQVYISAITLLCIGGIAAGVWLIVTVLSVMNGFERAWREQIVGDLAHFTVHSGVGRIEDWGAILEVVESVPDVESASPYVEAEGMVRTSEGRIHAVRLRGIDPETADRVSDLSGRLLEGSLTALVPVPSSPDAELAVRSPSGIIVGEPLAEKLGASVGDVLVLISPLGGPQTPLGPAPRLKRFEVVGIFRSELYQFGELYTYVDLSAAQDFLRAGDVVDGLEARTPDLYTSRRVAEAVRARLGSPYYTRDWKDHFPVFFAALRDNRSMMILLLSMVMVVAAFMIVATLMMMIMEKSSDIAILKAMGAEDSTIERVFAIEGALIGLAGTGLGVLAALAVTSRLGFIQEVIESVTGVDTLPASIYQLDTLPAEHDPIQLLGIVAMAMILALGATLVPSQQGARFDPVEGLRSE